MLPISDKWVSATKWNINYPRCDANYHWRTLDTHSQNEVVTMLLSRLPMNASNMSVMHNSDQSLLDYCTYKTTNCWRSADAHFDVLSILCLYKLPIRWLFKTTTRSLFNGRTYKTRNCRHSVDAHSQNEVVTVLESVVHIKAANMSVMHNSDQIIVQLPYLQDHKLLTLYWRSCQYIVHSTSAAIDNYFHHD